MAISNKYLIVTKLEEKKKEGFKVVEVEDASTYMGIVHALPEIPVYIGNRQLNLGDKIVFAKYSPSTHLIQRDGKELKYILLDDILEVI